MNDLRGKPLAGYLTTRHLRMVVATIEEGNLVRASKRLHMTQSAGDQGA
jgi:hypothetical protein